MHSELKTLTVTGNDQVFKFQAMNLRYVRMAMKVKYQV